MTAMAWTYLAYLAVCVAITVWVARTLRKHGTVFLLGEGEHPNPALVDSLSHLLVVGFYLVNLGVISFVLKTQERVTDVQSAIELLSTKVGTILVVIGGMHFLILSVFSKSRRHADARPNHDGRRAAVDEFLSHRPGHH